jgi:hypothetical protein
VSDDTNPNPESGQPPAPVLYLWFAFLVIVMITVFAVVGAYI